jgi:excinuclease ABC subunit A
VVPDPSLSIRQGALKPWENRDSAYHLQTLDALAKHLNFDQYAPWSELPQGVRHQLLYGTKDEVEFHLDKGDRAHYFRRPFEGYIRSLERRYRETSSQYIRDELGRYMNSQTCPACGGSRLRETSLAVRVGTSNIHEFTRCNPSARRLSSLRS